MNLISPVKNIQRTAISCPQRGLCLGMGQVPWGDFLCEKQRYHCSRKHKPYFYMFTKYNTWFTESSLFDYSQSPPDTLFYRVYKNIYGHNANLQVYACTNTHTHIHRGNFLNSKVV